MQHTTFTHWLESRDHHPEAPEAFKLTDLLSQAKPQGLTLRQLRKAIHLSQETLQGLLNGLVATAQASVAEIDGEVVYYGLP
jgi:hypothetical protein